jgi:hypothetical protein
MIKVKILNKIEEKNKKITWNLIKILKNWIIKIKIFLFIENNK